MADKLRVHLLSKELGVTSKAIIDKCQREGIDGITNHMSTVSAGLAETVREWFSEAGGGTAVETAAPVDLKKARARRRPSKKEEKDAAGDAQVAVAEAPIEEPPVEQIDELPPEETEVALPQPVEAPMEVTGLPAPDVGVIVEETPSETPYTPPPEFTPEEVRPAAKAPEPKPEPVRPAGPQNVPAPAQMKGPKVVGFAKPDPVSRPAPRMSRSPLPQIPGPEIDLPGGRKGPKGKGTGTGTGTDADTADRKSRHRINPRRSRGSVVEVGERLREWNERDLLERQERLQAASGRGIHARRAREKAASMPAMIAPRKTQAQVEEPVILHELCSATGVGLMQLLPKLKEHGLGMVGRNTVIPNEVAEVVMLDHGVELHVIKPKSLLDKLVERHAALERENPKTRPPVVTMLGHVDHGKTSLLDAIRKTSVVTGEAGGITQHIGAYQVERGDLSVTFLDTPGHEAFTAMRARGANLTDVVVLVVAADDGLMPQTIEAINHAKAAKVTIVVALNKIDLPGIDLNKVYGQLSEVELTPTEWGGDTDVVKTSATTGKGVEDLINHLVTLSELLDIKADPTVPARATVIEAQMQTGMGPLARVLVQEGTLRKGAFIVCGPGAGRVRTMQDDRGRQLKQATPGTPVEVAGLDEVPNAGDPLYAVDSLQEAKQIADEVKQQRRQASLQTAAKPATLAEILQRREAGEVPELNLILRADVQGSVDALLKSLRDLPGDQVNLHFLHTGVGAISESDVVLAEASGAMIIGFNITAETGAQKRAETAGVDVRLYRVIYDVTDDIRKALEGLLPKDRTEEVRGKAAVREIFRVSRVGTVAGCMVTDGVIHRSNYVKLIRDGKIIVPTDEDVKRERHRPIGSLRRFKDDAREVRAGMECGIRVDAFDDVKPGDVIEAYEVIETARKL